MLLIGWCTLTNFFFTSNAIHYLCKLFPGKTLLVDFVVGRYPLDVAFADKQRANLFAIGLDLKFDVLGENNLLRDRESNIVCSHFLGPFVRCSEGRIVLPR